jgi:hypothetical protein
MLISRSDYNSLTACNGAEHAPKVSCEMALAKIANRDILSP